jgi:cytoskeleton protein RodZ
LNSIEREDVASLPQEVFVKGFLRSYARAVGADGDIAVGGYLKSLEIVKKSQKTEEDLEGLSSRLWQNLLLTAGALMVLMVSSILMAWLFSEKPSASLPAASAGKPAVETQAAPPPAAPAPKPVASAPVAEPEPPKVQPPVAPPEKPPSKSQVLEITAVEETWMKIVIDDEQTKEVILKPGDRLALEASVGYNLLVGNAAGVRMTLNGQPVLLAGKSGQVRTVRLP